MLFGGFDYAPGKGATEVEVERKSRSLRAAGVVIFHSAEDKNIEFGYPLARIHGRYLGIPQRAAGRRGIFQVDVHESSLTDRHGLVNVHLRSILRRLVFTYIRLLLRSVDCLSSMPVISPTRCHRSPLGQQGGRESGVSSNF